MQESQEPQGIAFFNVKSGETHYAKLEPTIQAYINMSDLGINASRGQDFGWKLGADWVKRIRAFRRDPMQMQILSARNNGAKPTITQILYYLYGQELATFQEEQEEHEAPFAEQYQRDTAEAPRTGGGSQPSALADFQDEGEDDDIADLIDEEMDIPEQPDSPEPVETPKEETPVAAKPVANKVGRPAKQTQKAQ